MIYQIHPLKPFGFIITPYEKKTHITALNIEMLRKKFHEAQLIVLRGFDTFSDANNFAQYCESWGEISVWPFGKVLELVEHDKPEDHIFDHRYVPLHWDGMYRPQVPEYQIFHCVKAPLPEQAGRTIFSNTISVLNSISAELKTSWSKVTGIYQRKMQFYNSKTISPIIKKHPYQDFFVMRYNEVHLEEQGHFINPPEIEFMGIAPEEKNNFHANLKDALYHPAHCYAHTWQTGDVVIADNFSLLHGREAFVSKSERHIRRVHVLSNPPLNNPDLESYQ